MLLADMGKGTGRGHRPTIDPAEWGLDLQCDIRMYCRFGRVVSDRRRTPW
jgi:hypothetical protein